MFFNYVSKTRKSFELQRPSVNVPLEASSHIDVDEWKRHKASSYECLRSALFPPPGVLRKIIAL